MNTRHPFCSVVAIVCVLSAVSVALSATCTVITDGRLVQAEPAGCTWTTDNGVVVNKGAGYVYGACWLGADDFRIQVQLSVDDLHGNAACVIGRFGNRIVLGDDEGMLVCEGTEFGDDALVIGKAKEYLSAGRMCTIAIVRSDLALHVSIDDTHLVDIPFTEDHIEHVGLYTGTTQMKIASFAIEGDVRRYHEPYTWYLDDFEDESIGVRPSHWLPLVGRWVTAKGLDDNVALHCAAMDGKAQAVLHGFGKNSTFESRFKVQDHAEDGAVWFVVRHNLEPTYQVRAGYDFKAQKWVIQEAFGQKQPSVEVSRTMTLEKGIWYTVRLEAWGEALVLYVDDKKITNSNMLANLNYGRAGVSIDKAEVLIDDVVYRSEGRVQAGVDTSLRKNTITLQIFDTGDGSLAYKEWGGATWISVDEGLSWDAADFDVPGINTILLQSGKLLSLELVRHNNNTYDSQYRSSVSADHGRTWSEPTWVQKESGFYISMNGKLTQLSDGRVIFATHANTGAGKTGIEIERLGGTAVYYSDDEGKTWHESTPRLTFASTGANLQEAVVTELSDGRLKLFARTPYGTLYETVSDDRGATWSTDVRSTGVPSVMCAFNVVRDSKTGEHYLFWVYDDPNEHPMPQKPRERTCLAVSTDDTATWQFLTDVDDFSGHLYRFMNLGVYVNDEYVYTHAWIHGSHVTSRLNRITRFRRADLVAKDAFPPLH